jgi:hypothetical protein
VISPPIYGIVCDTAGKEKPLFYVVFRTCNQNPNTDLKSEGFGEM